MARVIVMLLAQTGRHVCRILLMKHILFGKITKTRLAKTPSVKSYFENIQYKSTMAMVYPVLVPL